MKNETELNHKTASIGKVMLGDVYLEILKKFTCKDDFREWMSKPFNSSNKTISTNGTCLVACPLIDGFEDLTEKVKTVYPIKHSVDIDIDVFSMLKKLEDFPMVDSFDEKYEKTKCTSCYGGGVVDFTFSSGSKDYTLEGDCPVCEGIGNIDKSTKVPNGKKEFDTTKFVKIHQSDFYIERINELIYLAKKLNVNNIKLVSQERQAGASLFVIGDIEFLAMPAFVGNKEDVVLNIA